MRPEKIHPEDPAAALHPLRAGEVQASVVLVPPLADGAEVQERVTHDTVTEMQRYVQLADKLLSGEAPAASDAPPNPRDKAA